MVPVTAREVPVARKLSHCNCAVSFTMLPSYRGDGVKPAGGVDMWEGEMKRSVGILVLGIVIALGTAREAYSGPVELLTNLGCEVFSASISPRGSMMFVWRCRDKAKLVEGKAIMPGATNTGAVILVCELDSNRLMPGATASIESCATVD